MKRTLCRWSLLFLATLVAIPLRADFSFVHVTDTHITASDAPGSRAAQDAALYQEINALTPRPAFILNTGDIAEVGTDAEYAMYRKIRANVTLPEYAAPGNHDVRWNPRGKEGFTLGTRQPLYQSWNRPIDSRRSSPNVHFVLLDSTILLEHWGHFDQAMLDWLQKDLQQAGPNTPIIVGFHHWIGREAIQIDNETDLLDILAPYNVRLFLIGHGHSDIQWNVRGVPAIMAKGLYQGSYHIIDVTRTQIRVRRRTEENKVPTTDLLTIPLYRNAAFDISVGAQANNDHVVVSATSKSVSPTAQFAYRIDDGAYRPMEADDSGWTADFSAEGLMPGEHTLLVEAKLPDGRAYQLPLSLALSGPDAPSPAWTATVSAAVQSHLVRSGDTLYVPTMGGDLVALDPATGAVRWRFHTGGAVFSVPHVADGTVYFGSADHFVYAVDAVTGALKWKTQTRGAVLAGADLAHGVVCIASVDTKIYGLDAATGAILWTAQGEGMYQSKVGTDGERFFVGGWDNYVRALDVKTGRELWKNRFGRSFYFAPAIGAPAVGAGKVFITSNDGMLHAMDAVTGKVLWEVGDIVYGNSLKPASPALGYSGPLYRDGRLYDASLTGKGFVFCFDATTGRKLWDTPTGSVIYDSSCAFGAGNIYVGSVDGTFSAIRATDGVLQWQYRLGPGHLLASPATDDARVYIGSMSGRVTALPLTSAASATAQVP